MLYEFYRFFIAYLITDKYGFQSIQYVFPQISPDI